MEKCSEITIDTLLTNNTNTGLQHFFFFEILELCTNNLVGRSKSLGNIRNIRRIRSQKWRFPFKNILFFVHACTYEKGLTSSIRRKKNKKKIYITSIEFKIIRPKYFALYSTLYTTFRHNTIAIFPNGTLNSCSLK